MKAQHFFEDIKPGDDLPAIKKGPLTSAHLMRWSAAMENWHKIHYDLPFAKEHDKLPALLINGSFKQQFLSELLKEWAGDQGWVWKINFQFRAMNLLGETLTIWGKVKDTRREKDYGVAELDIGIVNDEGKESTPGTAAVALPYRGGKPVHYPFVPPR
jgi:acyl dehydratase